MARLEKCECLIEYEKNLLVSALASYKAELNDFQLKLLGKSEAYLLAGTTAGDEFLELIGKRLAYIDKLTKSINETPKCLGDFKGEK